MDTVSSTPALAAFAATLVKAHAASEPTIRAEGAIPANYAEAMAVQAEVARLLGAQVAGWKVGATSDKVPCAAPIFTHFMRENGGSFPMVKSGLWGVEAEIGVRLRADLPPRPGKPYTREEIMEAIGSVFTGIEVVASRIIDFKAAPYPVFLADNIGNAGYVAGAEIANWRGLDLSKLRATLTINGETLHDAVGGHPQGDTLKPVIDYANAPNDGLGGLKAGQFITTGSVCGLVPISAAGEAVVAFEALGETRARFA